LSRIASRREQRRELQHGGIETLAVCPTTGLISASRGTRGVADDLDDDVFGHTGQVEQVHGGVSKAMQHDFAFDARV